MNELVEGADVLEERSIGSAEEDGEEQPDDGFEGGVQDQEPDEGTDSGDGLVSSIKAMGNEEGSRDERDDGAGSDVGDGDVVAATTEDTEAPPIEDTGVDPQQRKDGEDIGGESDAPPLAPAVPVPSNADERIDYSRGFEDETENFNPDYEFISGPWGDRGQLVQYHNSGDVGSDRSLKYWTPAAQANEYATLDDAREGQALPREWGPRDHVSTADIPPDADIEAIHGSAAAQKSDLTGTVYGGGGEGYRFKDFDPSWVTETRRIPDVKEDE